MRPPSQKITPPLRPQRSRCPKSDTTGRIIALFPRPVSLLVHHRAHPLQIPPNSRTGRGRVRAMSMVAVRHRPIWGLGARQEALKGLPRGIDVRLFGEKWMMVGTVDRFSFGTAFAARLVATILVIR